LNGHINDPTASVAHSLAIESKLVLLPAIESPRVATRDSAIFVGGLLNPDKNTIHGSGTAPKICRRNFKKTISYLRLLVVIGWWINNIKILKSIDRLNNKPSAREYLGMRNPECCHDVIRLATSKPS
jgi:hypothetical protein